MDTKLKVSTKGWTLNFAFVLLIYFIAHVLMLASNGVWWDDYVVWNVTPEKLYAYLGPGEANGPAQYAYISAVTNLFPLHLQVYVFHALAFLTHGISLLCCWFILKTITSDKAFTTMCCALIAAYGFDSTSMLIICSHYTIANCLFLIGLLACVKELYTGKKYLLYLVGAIWLLSLIVWRSSALLMPLCLLILSCVKNKDSWRTLRGWWDIIRYIFVHYWMVIALVLCFAPIYLFVITPSGHYDEYYTPKIVNIITSPVAAFVSAVMAVGIAVGHAFKSMCDSGSFVITILLFAVAGCIYWYASKHIQSEKEEISYKPLAGIAFLYLMVSMILQLLIYGFLDVLDISEYMSRLLSLAAFPTAIIIVYLLQYVHRKIRYVVFSLILTGFMAYTTYTYVDYSYAWHKTEVITDYMKQHPELDGANILVDDHAFAANENQSSLRFYAYEGMARMAYGQETKTKAEPSYLECYGSSFQPDYRMQCVSQYPIKKKDKCMLVFSKWLFKRKYQRLKGEMLQIEIERVNESR